MPYKRRRRPPPFTVDQTLRNITLGLTVGEAGVVVVRRKPPRKPRIKLSVDMCDEKAVRMIAEAWGTSVYQTGKIRCKPTPENPEGRAYVTEAWGKRADQIMKGYEPEITGTLIHKKYEEKKKRL